MFYIGVDLGDSAVKLLLIDSVGNVKKTISKRFTESNPDEWWNKTVAGLKEIINIVGTDISGICICSSNNGMVVLDENDELIRPDIIWNNTDISKENDYLKNVVGKNAVEKTLAPKLLWLLNNSYENFRIINKIMLPKDYLVFKLTGLHCTDSASATSTLLYDNRNASWSKEMLAICEVRKEWMPKIYDTFDQIDKILPSVAEELGISHECSVVAGTTASIANVISSGSLGAGKYNLVTNMLATNNSDKWWQEDILDLDGEVIFEEEMLGENHVFYLPGVMSETAFIGMNSDTNRIDMLQAIYEGIAYELRYSIQRDGADARKPQSLKISGKLAKNDIFRKILANILNVTIETIEIDEGAVFGTAILAAVACGAYAGIEEATDMLVKIKDSVSPDELLVEKYDAGYSKFVRYYRAINSIIE